MRRILWITTLVLLVTSCYKDKGNYDYSLDEMNKIESVTFTPESVIGMEGQVIELQQPLNESQISKKILVNVAQSLQKDIENLDFTWNVSYKNDENKTVKDVFHTKGFLDVELAVGKQKSFDVFLEIKDKTTTLAHYEKFLIKTRPIFKNSLFILHGEEGNRKLGNIETIGKETNVYANVLPVVNPEANPEKFANAVALTSIAFMNFSWPNNSEKDILTVFYSDAEAEAYNPFGMKLEYGTNYVIPSNDKSFVFLRNVETGDPTNTTYYHCVLSRGGAFLLGNGVPCLYEPGGEVDLDENPLHQNDYMVTAATITEERFVLWDAKNNRFLYVSKGDSFPWGVDNANMYKLHNPVLDAYVDFSSLTEATTPVGKRAVYAYIQYRENYSDSHPFFIFKDENTGEFYLYELTPIRNDNSKTKGISTLGVEKKDDSSDPVFTISAQKMRNFAPGEKLDLIMYNSWFSTNYLFYAKDENIYRYNVSNGDKVVIYSAPKGYSVSTMKFRTQVSSNFAHDLGRYLSIGLVKGNQGAVAELRLTTASDVDSDYKITFYDKDDEGNNFGPIFDLQFAHEYMYYVER